MLEKVARLDRYPPFVPFFRSGHLATMAGNFWPRPKMDGYPATERRYRTEPTVEIRVVEQAPAAGVRELGHLVLVHGLEGSSEGGYMQSMAYAALEAGFVVHRVNVRGCGGTEGWCKTLYHAGLTSDVLHVLQEIAGRAPRSVFLAGYSLGGNVALRLAGTLGERARGLLNGVIGVSAPIDLHACVRALARRENWIYEKRFVTRMQQRLQERRRLQPEVFAPIFARTDVMAIRTIFDFDDQITAPHFGFGNAPNYYATQSAGPVLPAIAVPGLLVTAQDDPLIPYAMYEQARVEENPKLQLVAPAHGGHVGFLAKRPPRFWLDNLMVAWMRRVLGEEPRDA